MRRRICCAASPGVRTCGRPSRADDGRGGIGLLIGSFVVGFVVGIAVLGWVYNRQRGNAISVVEVQVGDCFVLPISGAETEIYDVELVDCAEPHDVEVVGRGDLNPGGQLAYPSDEVLLPQVEYACGDPRRYHDVGFGVLAVAPNQLTWEQHAGTYVCLGLRMADGLVSGRQIAAGL